MRLLYLITILGMIVGLSNPAAAKAQKEPPSKQIPTASARAKPKTKVNTVAVKASPTYIYGGHSWSMNLTQPFVL